MSFLKTLVSFIVLCFTHLPPPLRVLELYLRNDGYFLRRLALTCILSYTFCSYEIYLLEAVSNILNFTYLISNPPDGKWGHVEENGWTGLVRHAQDGVVDFVICDVFLTYTRSKVCR